MNIKFHRLAGAGFGAALAIVLCADVEAAPMIPSQNPVKLYSFDTPVVKTATSVRVRRRGHRVPRQMAHRHRGTIHRERSLVHSPQ